jgi:hypothetical protein
LTFQEEFVPWRQSKWFRFCTHMRSPSPPLIARELGNDVVVRFFFFNLFFSPSSSLLWFYFITLCKMFYALGIWFQSGEGLVRILFRFDSHINKIAKKMKCKLEITAFLVVFISRWFFKKCEIIFIFLSLTTRWTLLSRRFKIIIVILIPVSRECYLQMSGAEPVIKG